jgi:hypothetical protein
MGGNRSAIGSFSNLRRNRRGGDNDRDLSTKVLYSITQSRGTTGRVDDSLRPLRGQVSARLVVLLTDLPFPSPNPDNAPRRQLHEERPHRCAPDLWR